MQVYNTAEWSQEDTTARKDVCNRIYCYTVSDSDTNDDSCQCRFLTLGIAGHIMRHSKTEDISYPNVVILFSAHYPFIGQLCIAIPTNRSTPYSMLVAILWSKVG